jgi:hypothetical protein
VAALGRGFVRFYPSGRAGVGWVAALEMALVIFNDPTNFEHDLYQFALDTGTKNDWHLHYPQR